MSTAGQAALVVGGAAVLAGAAAVATGGADRPSPHFTWPELDPWGDAPADARERLRTLAVTVLEPLRVLAGTPLAITPGGGYNGPGQDADRLARGATLRSPGSRHRRGEAADVRRPSSFGTYSAFVAFCLDAVETGKLPKGCGVGVYDAGDDFVHFDLGPNRGSKKWKGIRYF